MLNNIFKNVLCLSLATLLVSCVSTKQPTLLDDGLTTATPESVGVGSRLLKKASNEVLEISFAPVTAHIQNSKDYAGIDSILVAKNNKLIFEKYYNGFHETKPHGIASVGKSLLSALVGVAIEDGHISDTDESIYRFILYPDYQNWDENKQEIKLKHLLTMTTGWECGDINYYSSHCGAKMENYDDPYKWLLGLPMVSAPGKTFNYNDATPKLLTAILNLATKKSTAHYFHDKIMVPLAIENNVFLTNQLTSRDMLKIGLLFLNKGKWQSQQVISKNWVELSTKTHIPFKKSRKTKGYGYYWWQRELVADQKPYNSYYAAGAGGQFIIIVPELELVTVFTGSSNYNMNQVFEIMEKYILPSNS